MAAPQSLTDSTRRRDPERTRAEILRVATEEFARQGYSGARVDEIAARTRTTKRMIYYYFGGKEQLYTAVLEDAYGRIRQAEQELDVGHLDPVAAIRRLAEMTLDHHEHHEDFVRLVMGENMHQAEYVAASPTLTSLNAPAVEVTTRILEAGRAQGLFTADADALDVHMLISSFCFYRMGNRHTVKALFGRDMADPARREHYRSMVGDVVVAYLTGAQ